MGDAEDRETLVNRLRDALLIEKNNSRKQLMCDLITLIENAAPISVMLKPSKKMPEKMSPECVSRIVRSAYGVEDVKVFLFDALSDIWNYDNFNKVIQKNPLQFADPKDPATRKLIGRRYLANPDNNFAKYKFAFNLYHKLNTEIEALEKYVDHNWYRKKCNECFAEIESALSQILRGLGDEREKTFGHLISNALIKVGDAKQNWMDRLERTIYLPHSTLFEHRRYAMAHL